MPSDFWSSRVFAYIGAVFLAALFLVGCSHPLTADDVAIEYTVRAPEGVDLARPDLLTNYVRARLAVVRVSAEVTVDAKAHLLQVTVDARDERIVPLVISMLEWRGGIMLYEHDPTYDFVLPPAPDIEERFEIATDGTRARYFVGSRPALVTALVHTRVDQRHRAFIQQLDHLAYRTYIAHAKPAFDLTDGILSARRDPSGRSVEITLNKVGHERLRGADPNKAYALAQDQTVFAIERVPASDAPFVISFGDDIDTYARARREERLLSTPVLPPLYNRKIVHLGPNRWLELLSVGLPLLLSLFWLAIIRRFDRARPEPLWLVGLTFVLGAASAPPGQWVEGKLHAIAPILDPQLASHGDRPDALPMTIVIYIATVGIIEEGAKFLAVWAYVRRRREFDEPVDGIVYAAAAALGFAAAENVVYFTGLRMPAYIVVARGLLSVPGHVLFASLWGWALGQSLIRKQRAKVLVCFLLAAAMHGLDDALLTFTATAWIAVFLMLLLAGVFLVLVRHALQTGIGDAPPSAERAVLRVGRTGLCVLGCSIFIGSMWLLLTAVATFERSHGTAFVAFAIDSAILVLLIGASGWVVSTMLPLDVALDADGFVFSGLARSWTEVRGYEREVVSHWLGLARIRVLLRSGAPLLLGPADHATTTRLSSLFERHLARASADPPVPVAPSEAQGSMTGSGMPR